MRAPLRQHAPFLVLLALAVPAMFRFAASDVVASLGDDSVSYLMLARYILAPGDPLIVPWVGYQSHFPPLFPAILAATGGAWSLAVGHAVVAAFGVLSLGVFYRYAGSQLASNAAGFLVAALFVLTPGAWIALSGVLSETPFLFATLCALHYYESRLAGTGAAPRQWLLFGILLGAVVLLRSAGATLTVAYAVHVLVAAASRERAPSFARRLLPFVPVALIVGLWLAWRPHPEGFHYGRVTANIVNDLMLADPVRFLASCVRVTFGGWLRTFTADSDVHWLPKGVFAAFGLLAIAGALLRVRRNRLDGWYVLVTLPVVSMWLFSEDSSRRLLYPLVPLAILHAAMCVAHVARGIASAAHRRLFAATALAVPLAFCLPAWLLVQSRSLDLDPIHAGLRYRYADMTEYYTNLDRQVARAIAAKHAGVLAGLESLEAVTPPGARVMWLRPDYVAVLGERPGLQLRALSRREEFLREVQRSKAEYIVVSSLFKATMDGDESVPEASFNWAMQVSQVVHALRGVATEGYEVIVLKVDAAAVDRILGAAGPR